jgi:hypothetical protein
LFNHSNTGEIRAKYSTHEEMRKEYGILVDKSEGNNQLQRHGFTRENNIKIYFK